jgi:hypothetical protein
MKVCEALIIEILSYLHPTARESSSDKKMTPIYRNTFSFEHFDTSHVHVCVSDFLCAVWNEIMWCIIQPKFTSTWFYSHVLRLCADAKFTTKNLLFLFVSTTFGGNMVSFEVSYATQAPLLESIWCENSGNLNSSAACDLFSRCIKEMELI